MSMQITMSVPNCRECPHSTNNAREHNDPFTSAPLNVYWWCRHPARPAHNRHINDANKIDPNCPAKQEHTA